MRDRGEMPGHSNRIFCTKFNHVSPDILASAGWDKTVQIYDIRYRGPVKSIFGPYVCGDALAFRDDGFTLVTGSYKDKDAIEIWDLRMFKRTRIINWEGDGVNIDLFHDNMETDPDFENQFP